MTRNRICLCAGLVQEGGWELVTKVPDSVLFASRAAVLRGRRLFPWPLAKTIPSPSLNRERCSAGEVISTDSWDTRFLKLATRTMCPSKLLRGKSSTLLRKRPLSARLRLPSILLYLRPQVYIRSVRMKVSWVSSMPMPALSRHKQFPGGLARRCSVHPL
ncbi:hypothetical protein I7I53_12033 [Histoplasma capsulatum var. duboisii H88]|uniref:Uncharacterized protein n=1 Tax=Ajellomyces capsulatus (strain H88) TaxID=544711 RepID=A0A8A1M014_AJEC8|nr:hypothetical protein I7I53_12033 [Histoplasma capsulatum var. duboisii H88]